MARKTCGAAPLVIICAVGLAFWERAEEYRVYSIEAEKPPSEGALETERRYQDAQNHREAAIEDARRQLKAGH